MANTMSAKAGWRANPVDGETLVAHALTSEGHDASEDGTGRGTPLVTAFSHTQGLDAQPSAEAWPSLRREGGGQAVAYPLAQRGRDGGSELEVGEPGVYNALRAGDGGSSRLNQIMVGTGVRRLTPTECERLQAWPDGWTNPDGNAPDSRRYAACGDGVTASVAEWIGQRIMGADA